MDSIRKLNRFEMTGAYGVRKITDSRQAMHDWLDLHLDQIEGDPAPRDPQHKVTIVASISSQTQNVDTSEPEIDFDAVLRRVTERTGADIEPEPDVAVWRERHRAAQEAYLRRQSGEAA